MEFKEYLKDKKIDPEKFKAGDPAQYDEFKRIFDQVHPNSFTQQKLFLINKIRRSYQLKEQQEVKKPAAANSQQGPYQLASDCPRGGKVEIVCFLHFAANLCPIWYEKPMEN